MLALRGIRGVRQAVSADTDDAHEIGLVDEEVQSVLPELVVTNSRGEKSIHYSRLSVVLAEAVKEQQQLISEQATALEEALKRISALEDTRKQPPAT